MKKADRNETSTRNGAQKLSQYLQGLSFIELVKQAIKEFLDDDMPSYASALAYQALFSLFPFLIFLMALIGFLHLPDFISWLQQQAAVLMPLQALDEVNNVILQLQKSQVGLLSTGIIISLWSASAGIRSTMTALNNAYDVIESRPAWKVISLSVFYTIGLAILMLSAAALMVTGPSVLNWIARQVGMEQYIIILWTWLRWPIASLFMMVTFIIVYGIMPDVEQKIKFIVPGALISVTGWITTSLGFNWYVHNFADYNATYGSIGAIIILLFYFYLSAAVFLFGAEINVVIERHSENGKHLGERKFPQ